MNLKESTIELKILGPGTERDVYLAALKLLVRWPQVQVKDVSVGYTGIFNASFKLVVEGPEADVSAYESDFRSESAAICRY